MRYHRRQEKLFLLTCNLHSHNGNASTGGGSGKKLVCPTLAYREISFMVDLREGLCGYPIRTNRMWECEPRTGSHR